MTASVAANITSTPMPDPLFDKLRKVIEVLAWEDWEEGAEAVKKSILEIERLRLLVDRR